MKRAWVITVALLLLAVAAVVALWPTERQLPKEQCSAEYQQFSGIPGIRLAHIADFPINDSISVEVTTITATDSLSWSILKESFQIPEPTELGKELMEEGIDALWQWRYTPKSDTTTGTIIHFVFSHLTQTVSIYHLRSEDEYRAVFDYSIEISISNYYTEQHEKDI